MFSVASFVLSLSACSSSTTVQQAAPSDAGAAAVHADAGPPSASCLGILKCVSAQNCTANACIDACMGQGSADAQKQVTDLATCNQNASCQDATCLQANCKSQLDACVAGSAPPPSGTPLGTGTAPAGSIPADLVGTWTAGNSFDLSSEKQFVFRADGTAAYQVAFVGGIGGCTGSVSSKYEGTAVIDASAIKLFATSVTETTVSCGVPATKQNPSKTLSYAYAADNSLGPALLITDTDCAAQYTSQVDINLYCQYTYRKQP